MKIDACFRIGHVIKTHGLKGEISIQLDVDRPEDYSEMESVFVEINQKLVPFFIDTIQVRSDKALVGFEDITNAEEASRLTGCDLYLPLNLLPKLPEGKFYYHEITGYSVVDRKAGKLGTVTTVFTNPSQDLISMEYRDREVLIPVADEIVLKADHDQRTLSVDLPEGLLEVYLD